MYVTALKECRCCTENKIDVACNIAILEVLTTPVQKHRVLPSQETTATEHCTITIDSNRQGLTNRTSSVFKRNVLRREIISFDHCRRSAKRPDRFTVGPRQIGI